MPRRTPDARRAVEEVLARPDTDRRYVLRLYVSGRKPRSAGAIAALTTLCREHLEGRYDLEVIDVDQNPKIAIRDQILALPTLVKQLPEPLRRFVGDLADPERILVGLDIRPRVAS